MSGNEQGSPVAPEREETEDHDLLTYGEVGVRLFEEVEAQRALVAELVAAGEPQGPQGRLDGARSRLAALEEAADRNRRQTINDDNFERFFGYEGTARRNT